MCNKKKWYKVLYDYEHRGQVKKVECKNHSYRYTGTIPCTGIRKCVLCGKSEID